MPAPRWRRPNFLLIVCVAIGLWLVLVPLAGLLLTAFTEDTGLGFGAFTLDNFVEAYSGARILRLIGNSLVYAAGTAIVTFVIGGFVAWAVERTDAPGGDAVSQSGAAVVRDSGPADGHGVDFRAQPQYRLGQRRAEIGVRSRTTRRSTSTPWPA